MAAVYNEVVLTFTSAVVAGTAINIQIGAPALYDGDTVTLPATSNEFDTDAKVGCWRNGVYLHKGSPNDIYWVSTTQVALTCDLRVGDKVTIARITL